MRPWPTQRTIAFIVVSILGVSILGVSAAVAQVPGAVGIRISVSNADIATSSADLDLTMYTRGLGPYGVAGMSMIPALDYGDGATIASTTLALTNPGGGPGGSNVYRSIASFSHVYPDTTPYTATAGMACAGCAFSALANFPPGSPVPPTLTQTVDNLPTSVIGNLTVPAFSSGTSYNTTLSTSVRFVRTSYLALTNTARITFTSTIPTASEWGLITLGAALLAAGFLLIRRPQAF